ncbi:MAG: Holliday junction resolvase RuvX [Candidatus Niyogibacteria bacterium]|nr:MAG: Holliday junction resolvase RuvX [Candidatus Niyogibacteria bacterium]
MARILGIDYGTKKIGFALSDESQKIAFPKTVQPNVWDYARDSIRDFILKENVSEIVIGLPVGLNGEETPLSGDVRKFAEKLKEVFSVPIHFENEVYSSAQIRTEGSAPEHKIDASSAALILQTFLDRRRDKDL